MLVASSRFNPARGGHAPGYLREAFCWAIEQSRSRQDWWESLTDPNAGLDDHHLEGRTAKQVAHWLTGQLWDCTDVLPGDACDDLELPRGSTYAQAARRMRADLD